MAIACFLIAFGKSRIVAAFFARMPQASKSAEAINAFASNFAQYIDYCIEPHKQSRTRTPAAVSVFTGAQILTTHGTCLFLTPV